MSVVCPKCKKVAERVYPESIEDEITSISDMLLQFDRLSLYQCTDKENCAYVFNLSRKDIMKTFMKEKGNIDVDKAKSVMMEGIRKLKEGDIKDA